jgi:hypothetical protein
MELIFRAIGKKVYLKVLDNQSLSIKAFTSAIIRMPPRTVSEFKNGPIQTIILENGLKIKWLDLDFIKDLKKIGNTKARSIKIK